MTAGAKSNLNGHLRRFRADRLLTLYGGYPISKIFRDKRIVRLPILMYHGIRKETGSGHPYFETNTCPEVFARHLKFLREEGYRAMDLDEVVKSLASGDRLDKRVVITFDDGYRDFYTHAFPVLHEYNFTATLFLVTGRIGNDRVRLGGNEYLTWSEVRELHAHGVTIGSHTVTHPELRNLEEPEIDRELSESKRTIEDKLGAAVRSFAYPYAFPETDHPFVKRLEAKLEKQGYENGVSTIIGTASARSRRYSLPRLPVNDWDDMPFFKAKLEGGYDCLHTPQILAKAVKEFVRFRLVSGDLQRRATR